MLNLYLFFRKKKMFAHGESWTLDPMTRGPALFHCAIWHCLAECFKIQWYWIMSVLRHTLKHAPVCTNRKCSQRCLNTLSVDCLLKGTFTVWVGTFFRRVIMPYIHNCITGSISSYFVAMYMTLAIYSQNVKVLCQAITILWYIMCHF